MLSKKGLRADIPASASVYEYTPQLARPPISYRGPTFDRMAALHRLM